MDLWEGIKFGAAILGAILLAALCDWFSYAAYPVKYPERPSYNVPGVAEASIDLGVLRRSWPQALRTPADRARLLGYMRDMRRQAAINPAQETGAPAAPAVDELPDFAKAIPAASVSAGQEIAQRCQQCHDLSKGGPNKIGPNLWGIIGRRRASHPGFDYSSAMTAKGGAWTYDEIFRFLHAPASYIPGTKMTFAGLPRAQDRVNLIAYMRTWADSPPALPPPAPSKPQATADTNAKANKPAPAKTGP